jgi:hypothetical protein
MDSPFVRGGELMDGALSMRMAIACSRTGLVEKGRTGALILLSVIVVEAVMVGLPDMKRKHIL